MEGGFGGVSYSVSRGGGAWGEGRGWDILRGGCRDRQAAGHGTSALSQGQWGSNGAFSWELHGGDIT